MFGPRGAAHTTAIHSTLYIAHMVEKLAKIAKISKGVELLGEDMVSVEGRHWWWSPGAQCARQCCHAPYPEQERRADTCMQSNRRLASVFHLSCLTLNRFNPFV